MEISVMGREVIHMVTEYLNRSEKNMILLGFLVLTVIEMYEEGYGCGLVELEIQALNLGL